MNEIKDLYDAGSAVEATLPLLEQALSALMITMGITCGFVGKSSSLQRSQQLLL